MCVCVCVLTSVFDAPEQITDFADKTDVSVVISQHKKRGTFLSENTIWSIFIQVVLGLQYLHRHSILHRVCPSRTHTVFAFLFTPAHTHPPLHRT